MSYTGKILRVDLSTGAVKVENLPMDLAKAYIGGRGLGTKLFCDEVDPTVDPLCADNKLLMVTGPLTGTSAPTGGRYMVVTKSPLTGAIASSNSGGFFGAKLKDAGYDIVIFEGRAAQPVYLKITQDKAEILTPAIFFIKPDEYGHPQQREVHRLPKSELLVGKP